MNASRRKTPPPAAAPPAACGPEGTWVRIGGKWRGVDAALPEAVLREHRIPLPPAYDPAWVCRSPGRVVAVGVDAKGRRQVLYSDAAVREREERKREHLARNLACVPAAVEKLRAHLRKADPAHPKPEDVMTLAAVILHDTGIRLGKQDHLVAGESHGLSTLQCRHVHVEQQRQRPRVRLSFAGKHRVLNEVAIEDPDAVRWVAALASGQCGAKGDGTRAFFGAGGEWVMHHRTFSRWLAKKLGPRCAVTPKEFRTVVANRIFLEAVRDGATAPQAVAETARRLNNTPAVVRKSYVVEDVMVAVETAPSLPVLAGEIRRAGVDAFLATIVGSRGRLPDERRKPHAGASDGSQREPQRRGGRRSSQRTAATRCRE